MSKHFAGTLQRYSNIEWNSYFQGTCQNGGSFSCGSCNCLPLTSGQFCENQIDCHNNTVPPGQPVASFDVCNICGGNGTTCIGCDGRPHPGKPYLNDSCGICGGDGSTCYNPCATYLDCNSCILGEICQWCNSETPSCINKQTNVCLNPSNTFTSVTMCSNGNGFTLNTKEIVAASIGAGTKKEYTDDIHKELSRGLRLVL